MEQRRFGRKTAVSSRGPHARPLGQTLPGARSPAAQREGAPLRLGRWTGALPLAQGHGGQLSEASSSPDLASSLTAVVPDLSQQGWGGPETPRPRRAVSRGHPVPLTPITHSHCPSCSPAAPWRHLCQLGPQTIITPTFWWNLGDLLRPEDSPRTPRPAQMPPSEASLTTSWGPQPSPVMTPSGFPVSACPGPSLTGLFPPHCPRVTAVGTPGTGHHPCCPEHDLGKGSGDQGLAGPAARSPRSWGPWRGRGLAV